MKKFISILLAAIICTSSVSAFAEHEGPGDASNTHNVDKDKIVSDIYEGGRREEMGEIFYVPGENSVSSEAKFLMDMGVIDHYHPDSALQRNVLKKLFEVIYGNADTLEEYFRGEGVLTQTLTFNEALVIFMDITGYSAFAKARGGDILNYILIAGENGLLDDVDVKEAQTKLSAKHFVQMAYNTICADLVETIPDGYGTKFNIAYGESLLTQYLKLTRVDGIVRANSYTSIIGTSGAGKNRIMIEKESYTTAVFADDFLGYRVIAFADKDGVIRSISADERKNSFIEFDNDDEILESTSKEVLTYYDENYRRKTLDIDKYADLIYNHILCPTYSSDFYVIKNGTLKLIDNNGDEKYDVVFKKEYTSFLPLSKSEDGGTVTDRNSVVYDISDVLDGKYKGIRSQNGEVREFKDFTNTTGVSVLLQKDTNKVTEFIILDKKTFEGSYRSGNEPENRYEIGDREFKMAQVYRLSCKNKFPFALGSNVLVYLDMFDTIIFAETTTTSYKYAWLIDMYKEDGGENTILKLFTEDDVISRYQLTQKVNLDGTTCTELGLFNKANLYEGGNTVAQMIKYKINKDGHINGIMTADTTSNCAFGAKQVQGEDDFQMNLNFWDDNKSLKYYGNDLNSFAGKYYIDVDKTKIFGIPTAETVANEGEESAYRIITTLETNRTYKLNLYDVDYEYRIGAAALSVTASASQWVNKGYGSQIALSSHYEWDPLTDEVIGVLHAASANGGTWTQNIKDNPNGYYGNQLAQTHWDYKNLFTYAYPESKKLTNDPNRSVRDKIKEEYAKYVSIADVKPGTIFKYTSLDGYVAFFNIEFMVIPDMAIKDHFFEFGWNDSGDDASYSDMYDDSGNMLEEFVYDNVRTGLGKTKFYGSEIIAFGQVTEKFIDGFVFNAHVGEEDEVDWNRRISALPTKEMRIYHYDRDITEASTVAELQAGDYIFLNMVRGKIQGIVVYRGLPNV